MQPAASAAKAATAAPAFLLKAAAWSGSSPLLSLARTSAPASTRAATAAAAAAAFGLLAAAWSGSSPLLSLARTSAPAANSAASTAATVAALVSPLAAAKCRGVSASLPHLAFTSQPACSAA